MMVGWGEAMDLVADELLTMPGIEEAHVTAGPWPQSLEYFMPSTVALQTPRYELDDSAMRQWVWTDYWVITYPEVQRQLIHADLLSYFQARTPVATIEHNGDEYAWIYDLRTAPLPDYFLRSGVTVVDWGDHLRYVGTRIADKIYAPGERLPVTLYFQTLRPSDSRFRAVVRLVDPEGRVIGDDNDTADRPDDARTVWPEVQALRIPSDAAPGTYEVTLSVTDYSTGEPLPATRSDDGSPQPSEIVIQTVEVGTGDEG